MLPFSSDMGVVLPKGGRCGEVVSNYTTEATDSAYMYDVTWPRPNAVCIK